MAVTLVRIGSSGRSTLAKGKPSLLGMVARGGDVVIHLLDHVKHVTIEPLLQITIVPSTCDLC